MAHLTYYPEMNEAKPEGIGDVQLSHNGKHRYIKTKLELKGRGITFLHTLTAADLVPQAQHKVGYHEYRVTHTAFEKLCEKYDFVTELLL